MRSRLIGLLGLALVAALSVAAPARAIVSGAVDVGHPEVVVLLRDGEMLGSGTLVTPTMVLTAAHLLVPAGPTEVVFGTRLGEGRHVAVRRAWAHPQFDKRSLDHDLGLVELATPVQSSGARLLDAWDEDAAPVASLVTIVGFGFASPYDREMPRKRSGTARISKVTASGFELEPAPTITCAGDSGGAVFAERDGQRTLLGVVSSGDLLCRQRTSVARVDVNGDDFLTDLRLPTADRESERHGPFGHLVAMVAALATLVGLGLLGRKLTKSGPRPAPSGAPSSGCD